MELQIAGELNPGPWVKHSKNVGIAWQKGGVKRQEYV